MVTRTTLEMFVSTWAGGDAGKGQVAETLKVIAEGCVAISTLIARGPLAGDMAQVRGGNADGDAQKELDIVCNDLMVEALKSAPVAVVGSEELEEALVLDAGQPVAVAMDPLDGSSNIETNAPIGTIFNVLPVAGEPSSDPEASFLQPGTAQLAAGYAIYGPHTAIVMSVGQGTQIFTLDRDAGEFVLTSERVQIPPETSEYAINGSNYRHWRDGTRRYINDCLAGKEGPRDKDFNMRWLASLVADTYRIFSRGGVFLYPGDERKGYDNGRLRLVYEANPIAMLIEQAGGRATAGQQRVLEVVPSALHERSAFIFGSRDEVRIIEHYKDTANGNGGSSPLFGKRGLFRQQG